MLKSKGAILMVVSILGGVTAIFIYYYFALVQVREYTSKVLDERVSAKPHKAQIREITSDSAAYPRSSPDGDWIAYLADLKPAIIKPDGTEKRLLFQGRVIGEPFPPYRIRWSRRNGVLFDYFSREKNQRRLLCFLFDSQSELIVENAGSADWSPDGNSLVFARDLTIQLMDLETSTSRMLLDLRTIPNKQYRELMVEPLSWTQNDQVYFFLSCLEDEHSSFESFLVELDPKASTHKILLHDMSLHEKMIVSPDSQNLLFSTSMENQQHLPYGNKLTVFSLIEGSRRTLSHMATGLSWSPAGDFVLYYSFADNGLFISEKNGQKRWFFEWLNRSIFGADWSPNGQIVAALGPDGSGEKAKNINEARLFILSPPAER